MNIKMDSPIMISIIMLESIRFKITPTTFPLDAKMPPAKNSMKKIAGIEDSKKIQMEGGK